MADQKSEQEKDKDASPRVPLRPDMSRSTLRRQYFRYVHKNNALPTSGDLIKFCQIPAGAKIMGGRLKADAGLGADTTKIEMGIVGDTAGLMAATTMGASAVDLEFGHTRALDWGKLFTVETRLDGKISNADTDGVDDLEIVGYLDYTLD